MPLLQVFHWRCNWSVWLKKRELQSYLVTFLSYISSFLNCVFHILKGKLAKWILWTPFVGTLKRHILRPHKFKTKSVLMSIKTERKCCFLFYAQISYIFSCSFLVVFRCFAFWNLCCNICSKFGLSFIKKKCQADYMIIINHNVKTLRILTINPPWMTRIYPKKYYFHRASLNSI